MPKDKKPKVKLPNLPDKDAIKRLFPSKVLEQVQAVVQGLAVKRPHK